MTQVCINKQRIFTRLGHKDCQVSWDDALAIAGHSTRDHQGMQRFAYAREPDVSTQNAVDLDVGVVQSWIKDMLIFRRARIPDCSQKRPAQQLSQRLRGTDLLV